ncbi:MAG: DNA-binding response regulator [Flavobacteriales bacterium]|nr:DNA-binding response regulator [Flavobacteriales bacterium]
MDSSAELRRSGFWTAVVLYGLALAALVFVLKYIEYRYLLRELGVEVYIGVVAALFTALGIWMGSLLLTREGGSLRPRYRIGRTRRHGVASASAGGSWRCCGLMATGRSNQETWGDQLFTPLPTVKSHYIEPLRETGRQASHGGGASC